MAAPAARQQSEGPRATAGLRRVGARSPAVARAAAGTASTPLMTLLRPAAGDSCGRNCDHLTFRTRGVPYPFCERGLSPLLLRQGAVHAVYR